MEVIDPKGTDKTELHEFLPNSGVNIEQINITLHPTYLEKSVAEIVEGQVRKIGRKPLMLIENDATE